MRAGWTPVPVPALPAQDLAFYARPGAARTCRGRRIPWSAASCRPTTGEPTWPRPSSTSCARTTPRRNSSSSTTATTRSEIWCRRWPASATTGWSGGRCWAPSATSPASWRRGALIAHWDDDDWQAPRRLSVQASRLDGGKADLCGAGSLLFWDPPGNRAWRYTWPTGRRGWAAGTSLCYPKSLWQRTPFPEVPTGEDTRFIWQSAVRRLADVRDENCVVGLVHAANTVPKTGRGAYWARAGISEVTRCLGSDVEFYQGLRRTPQVASAASG